MRCCDCVGTARPTCVMLINLGAVSFESRYCSDNARTSVSLLETLFRALNSEYSYLRCELLIYFWRSVCNGKGSARARSLRPPCANSEIL